jgi:holdfast attachment protein HfaA
MLCVESAMSARLSIAALSMLIGALPASALAQTMSANSAAYNAGFGRTAGQENQAAGATLRDANGNLVVVNGVIQSSASASAFSGGAANASAGAGFDGATAIGNNLSVVTQGDNNTVVIDSRQTNTGAVTATTSTSGATHGP